MLDWIKDIDFEDLLEKDTRLIAEHCGADVLLSLWANLPSVSLFISTRPLQEARKRYIRQYYTGPDDVKKFAARLGCSEKFVYEALSQTGPDDRQGRLL